MLAVEVFWWAFNGYVFIFGGTAVVALIPGVLASLCIVSAVLVARSRRTGFWLGLIVQIPVVLEGMASLSSYSPVLGVFEICLGLGAVTLLLLGLQGRLAQ